MFTWLRRMMATERIVDPAPSYTLRDRYKAECLRLMAAHAAIAPRGFDTQRDRAELHRRWDDAYDRYKRCGG